MPELLGPQKKLGMKIQAIVKQGKRQSRLGAAHIVGGGFEGKIDGASFANLRSSPEN